MFWYIDGCRSGGPILMSGANVLPRFFENLMKVIFFFLNMLFVKIILVILISTNIGNYEASF